VVLISFVVLSKRSNMVLTINLNVWLTDVEKKERKRKKRDTDRQTDKQTDKLENFMCIHLRQQHEFS